MKTKGFAFVSIFAVLGFFISIGCKPTTSEAQPPEKKDVKMYKIEATTTTLKKGAKGTTSFAIVLAKGAKVHPKAPFRCKLQSTAGVKLDKNKLNHNDRKIFKKKHRVNVSVGLLANAAGKNTIKMNCSFFICKKDICARRVEKVQTTVNVK